MCCRLVVGLLNFISHYSSDFRFLMLWCFDSVHSARVKHVQELEHLREPLNYKHMFTESEPHVLNATGPNAGDHVCAAARTTESEKRKYSNCNSDSTVIERPALVGRQNSQWKTRSSRPSWIMLCHLSNIRCMYHRRHICSETWAHQRPPHELLQFVISSIFQIYATVSPDALSSAALTVVKQL